MYEVAGPKRVPIIGQGGITTPTDALEFLIAGASAVGIGTALFYDPLLCKKINAGIADYLRETAGMALGQRARPAPVAARPRRGMRLAAGPQADARRTDGSS